MLKVKFRKLFPNCPIAFHLIAVTALCLRLFTMNNSTYKEIPTYHKAVSSEDLFPPIRPRSTIEAAISKPGLGLLFEIYAHVINQNRESFFRLNPACLPERQNALHLSVVFFAACTLISSFLYKP